MAQLVPDHEHHRTEIVRLACEEGLSNSAIGQKLGYSPATIRTWLERPEYKEAVKTYYAILEEETFRLAGVTKAKRVQQYQELLDALWSLKQQRGEAYSHIDSGGDTGLLVKQVKTVGTGQNAYDVAEYLYDSAVVRDILSINKQIAQEMGQWSEKSDHNINVTETVKVIRFVEQERPPDDSIEAEYREAGD
jgi:hypothetical protein